jgi:hypothetical protein
MSKNTKHKNYKSYLKLLTEQEKLEVIRRNLGYRELEQQDTTGMKRIWCLGMISQIEMMHIYQHLIDNYTSVTWAKDGVFYYKKRGCLIDNLNLDDVVDEIIISVDPRILSISFMIGLKMRGTWYGIKKYFYSYVPSYYFVMKIRKSYLTHEKSN